MRSSAIGLLVWEVVNRYGVTTSLVTLGVLAVVLLIMVALDCQRPPRH